MQISESWLREWASPRINSQRLAEQLTLAGLEVESIDPAGPELDADKIVIGEILDIKVHPDSRKLKICKVDIGKKKASSIVCGAPNASIGLKTAVALSGAKLPSMMVSRREIRGVRSAGMLCSAADLGLEDSSEGIIEFDGNAKIGRGVSDYLSFSDKIFGFELTPNRGDCLGVVGVAREVATLTGVKLKQPKIAAVVSEVDTALEISLKAPHGCPRYVGRAITNIDMSARSPDWMVERLRRSGLRSINAIVDITNYVMMELGQPMHAFDLKKISGGITVRMAKNGERLKLLDGSSVKLNKENLLIADHKKGIALAGIMGGANSAISSKTKSIYLEAAYFSALGILGKARKFGMHTDASHRFERGVDSELQIKAMERATKLVLEIAGGNAGPTTHAAQKSALPKSKNIKFERSEISRILGIEIPTAKATRIMKDLGMTVKNAKGGWQVKAPSWRFDIREQHDLVEEIGRCFGFDKVKPRMPNSESKTGQHLENKISVYDIKQILVQRGYYEAITYSFVDIKNQKRLLGKGNAILLSNPIADNMAVMRQSLWPGLLEALQNNLNRQESRVRLFETGKVFSKANNPLKATENQRLAGLISGDTAPRQWGSESVPSDFYDIKGDLESVLNLTGSLTKFRFESSPHPTLHPGQSAKINFGKKQVGYIGKLNPEHQNIFDIDQSVYVFEIDLDVLNETLLPNFTEISKFPSIQRDIAVLVNDDVEARKILNLVQATAGNLLKKLELFDIYEGKNINNNKKSFAFALTFQSKSSNLTSLEVDAVIEKVVGVLEDKLGAQLRT